jgi:Holliday junction resolvase RusA-like endonuclease
VTIVIELAGEPKGKGRPRFSRKNGVAYTPASTRQYEVALRYVAQEMMAGRPPIEGPVTIAIDAYFAIPASWSKRKQEQARAGMLRPQTKPDVDNVLKGIDSLNQIVWRDDKQVVEAIVRKQYSDRPRLRIEVIEVLA